MSSRVLARGSHRSAPLVLLFGCGFCALLAVPELCRSFVSPKLVSRAPITPSAPAGLRGRHAGGLWSAKSFASWSGRNGDAGATHLQALQASPRNSNPIARRAFNVDLTGKVAFLCGASSEKGYGWAIAKELAEAGATIVFGTWPVGLKIFQKNFKKKSMEDARRLSDGSLMEIAKVYPLDAVFDEPSQIPEEILNNKRYQGHPNGFTIQDVVDQVKKDFGQIDILVHALANGPEVTKPLLDTSREGYLAASSASAYSLVSMVSRFGPIMSPGGSVVSLSYIASQKVIPGYGGGMSSAKAQLESDTRTLAYEAGRRYGIRVNTICAGPMATRAATAISDKGGGKPFIMRAIEYSEANAPLPTPLVAEHVGKSAFFLLTDLSAAVTGTTLPVDMGLHAMGMSLDSPAFEGADL